jgi:hypothetical protein
LVVFVFVVGGGGGRPLAGGLPLGFLVGI